MKLGGWAVSQVWINCPKFSCIFWQISLLYEMILMSVVWMGVDRREYGRLAYLGEKLEMTMMSLMTMTLMTMTRMRRHMLWWVGGDCDARWRHSGSGNGWNESAASFAQNKITLGWAGGDNAHRQSCGNMTKKEEETKHRKEWKISHCRCVACNLYFSSHVCSALTSMAARLSLCSEGPAAQKCFWSRIIWDLHRLQLKGRLH